MTQRIINIKKLAHRICFVLLAVCAIIACVSAFCLVSRTESASAASTSGFKAGNIISDAVMSNYDSMSIDDIQNFLTKKNPCNNTNYSLYVEQSNRYPNTKWHWDNGHFVCLSQERFGDGTTIGSGQTAAEIIYAAAQANRINPQVLIVLLEKEQGLITDTYPHSGQYRAATGYGCPDTAACNSKYYGFKNQVYRAAELFRYTLDHGYSVYPEKKNGVYIRYNPSASCGSSAVYIENRATAALYRYTPYQPNSAALAAGYGLGNACSAYGNRNFYLYFTDWFGSTQIASSPSPDTSAPSRPITDGTYVINSSANPKKVLDVADGRDQNGTNIQLWSNNGSVAQQWRITYNSATNDYDIRNVMSGRALDLTDASAHTGANVQLYAYNSSCAQRWKFLSSSNGAYVIASSCNNGYVLDISNGVVEDRTNIQVWPKNGTYAQGWKLTSL